MLEPGGVLSGEARAPGLGAGRRGLSSRPAGVQLLRAGKTQPRPRSREEEDEAGRRSCPSWVQSWGGVAPRLWVPQACPSHRQPWQRAAATL